MLYNQYATGTQHSLGQWLWSFEGRFMLWLMRGISSGSTCYLDFPSLCGNFCYRWKYYYSRNSLNCVIYMNVCLEEAVVCIICISWQHWDSGFLLALVIYNIMCWTCGSVCSPAFPCVLHFHTTYPVSLCWPLGYEIASATKIVKKEEVFVFSSQCVASLWSFMII